MNSCNPWAPFCKWQYQYKCISLKRNGIKCIFAQLLPSSFLFHCARPRLTAPACHIFICFPAPDLICSSEHRHPKGWYTTRTHKQGQWLTQRCISTSTQRHTDWVTGQSEETEKYCGMRGHYVAKGIYTHISILVCWLVDDRFSPYYFRSGNLKTQVKKKSYLRESEC